MGFWKPWRSLLCRQVTTKGNFIIKSWFYYLFRWIFQLTEAVQWVHWGMLCMTTWICGADCSSSGRHPPLLITFGKCRSPRESHIFYVNVFDVLSFSYYQDDKLDTLLYRPNKGKILSCTCNCIMEEGQDTWDIYQNVAWQRKSLRKYVSILFGSYVKQKGGKSSPETLQVLIKVNFDIRTH